MDKFEKRRLIVYSIVMIIGVLSGIRSVVSMLIVINKYGKYTGELLLDKTVEIGGGYCLFMFLMFVSFILSYRARSSAKHWEFILRNIAIILAVIIGSSSSVAVLVLLLLGYSKDMGDVDMLRNIYNTDEVKYLISNPYEFYVYMVAVAIMIPFMIKAIYDLVYMYQNRKRK